MTESDAEMLGKGWSCACEYDCVGLCGLSLDGRWIVPYFNSFDRCISISISISRIIEC